MGKRYKLILQYDGTRYDGWQRQGNTEHTIQGKLEQIVTRLNGKKTEVHGSGRTDAGVHALGQAADFYLDEELEPEAVMKYVNQYLPEDIAVIGAEVVKNRFHSRLNAVKKTYTYYIETKDKKPVFERRYLYGYGSELDLDAMKEAALVLMGTHDFKSFCGNKNMKKSTVRTLFALDISKDGSKIVITFTGDGFLNHMVRIITGTLIEIGSGKRKAEDMKRILEAGDRQAAGFTAPPEGLFLTEVEY